LSTRTLIRLATIALIARAALLWFGPWDNPRRAFLADSAPYWHLAENLKDHASFGLRQPEGLVTQSIAALRSANGTLPGPDANGLRPDSFRMPGYPTFLASILHCGGSIRSVLVVQCLLGTLSVCLVAWLAQALGLSIRGAVVAGLLWALNPGLLVYDVAIAPASLFNAGVILALFLAARMPPLAGVPAAGLLLGLAALVQPAAVLYLPAALALAWPRTPYRILAGLGLIFAAGLFPAWWVVRNQAVGEGWRLSSAAESDLLYDTAARAVAEERRQEFSVTRPTLIEEMTGKLTTRIGPGQDVVQAARKLAQEEIAARPGAMTRVQLKSLSLLLIGDSIDTAAAVLGRLDQSPGFFTRFIRGDPAPLSAAWTELLPDILWTTANALIALGALAGLLASIRLRSWRLVVVGGVTSALLVIGTGSAGCEALRLYMLLPLILLAASLFGRRPTAQGV
jgi:hypothetical protein